jgi:hypothetical protein
MAVQTTFSMFQQLLKDAIDADSSLSDTFKAALKLRVDALPKYEPIELTAGNVDSVVNAVVSEATDSITVPSGSSAEVEWDLITFATPVRIDGTIGGIGALLGHTGQGVNTAIAEADITLQYRLTASGTYVAFGRTTVLDNVSTIQFKALIATQVADGDLPQLHMLPEQL